ncbi:Poly [ADP-ribose] polymerase 2 [Haplosporangium gracile]|nr:Poly [ADP-ribose] polymerase 2 [Haplosporangium gracile]
MPPKRAASKKAAPATPYIEGCVLAIAGTSNNLNQAQIEAIVTTPEFGATVTSTVTKKVTHLITNAAEVAKGTTKVTKATTLGSVQLVTLDWILDMQQQKKRLDEAFYKVGSTAAAPITPVSLVSAASPAADPPKRTAAKRKATAVDTDSDDDEEVTVEKKIKTLKEKVAKSTSKVKQPPVDPACGLRNSAKVYTDDDVAWDARLNQTNIGHNNNKFYRIQLLLVFGGQYTVYCHWGRVGAHGQSSIDNCPNLDAGKSLFEKKYKDKTRNNWADRDNFVKVAGKYHLLPPDEGDSDEEDDEEAEAKKAAKKEKKEAQSIPESKLHPKVQDLVSMIFNTKMMDQQMIELDYDAKKMPLGKLAKATILGGYEVLKKIAEIIDKPRTTAITRQLQELSSDFYTVIPHSFGMKAPPVINTAPMVKTKLEMLEALGEIEIAQKLIKDNKKLEEALAVNLLDQQYASLRLNKLEPMDKESERFKLIEQFARNSHGKTHFQYALIIDEVFDLDREGEQERFKDAGFDKLHNRRLLWHGSRLTNYVGILSQGLRIAPPEAPVSGYMFDKGAYFADCASKSANYCYSGPSNNTGLMLLCEVALGDMHELQNSDYNAKVNSEKAGKHSTKGCGHSYPKASDDVIIEDNLRVQAGELETETEPLKGNGFRLQYNEFIVYNTSQIKMRYLIKVKFAYGSRRF